MSNKVEEIKNKIPLEITSRPIKEGEPEETFEITSTELKNLMFTQKLFFEFSNMFKQYYISTIDKIKDRQLELGKLRYIFEEDVREVIKEDGTKVRELRPDFFENTHSNKSAE